jgi:hypothetical protein
VQTILARTVARASAILTSSYVCVHWAISAALVRFTQETRAAQRPASIMPLAAQLALTNTCVNALRSTKAIVAKFSKLVHAKTADIARH